MKFARRGTGTVSLAFGACKRRRKGGDTVIGEVNNRPLHFPLF